MRRSGLNLDPELEELFPGGPDREVVEAIKASRPAQPPLDPYFRNHLRMKLMAEARRRLTPQPKRAWLAWPRLPILAAAAAACAVVLVVGLARQLSTTGELVAVNQPAIAGSGNVPTVEPIKIAFTGPVDKNAVASSVVIEPATLYTTRWDGQTLVIIPLHPLAANTAYSVKLVPTSAAAAKNPTATAAPPVVVRFVTAPSALSPVLPPSFRNDNLTFIGEAPIADPGAVTSAIWTPDGQALIVTRPASGSVGSNGQATEVWWMTPQGTFVRRLAPRATLPSIAPDGRHLAFWRLDGSGQPSLWITAIDDDGSHATQVASQQSAPGQPAVWVGNDRLAYVEGTALRLVDIQGSALPLNITISADAPVAASIDGHALATLTPQGATLFDVASGRSQVMTPGVAAQFAWSMSGQLAFILSQPTGSQVWIDSPTGLQKVAESTTGDSWSGISWSPDSTSLLVATRGVETGAQPGAFLVNADGTGQRIAFGAQDREYTTPRWSPDGASVLFFRGDETGRPRLWAATVRVGQLSATDRAQLDAEHVVTRFLDARRSGNLADAQAELSAQALAAYQNGNLPLVSAPGDPVFARSYVLGVQLVNPDQFLITVRIVLADRKTKQEIRFFEEHLTVVRHDQQFIIDSVQAGITTTLGQGPSVVSVQVQPASAGQQVVVKFDADLNPGTVSRDAIFLRDDSGKTLDPASFQFDQNTRTVVIMAKLPPGKYTLVVTSAVTDIHGQGLAQEYDYAVVISRPSD
jgi:Tol biopolymer transport system component